MDEAIRKMVNVIITYCLKYKVGKIVIGRGWDAQKNSNIGDANNQNFCFLPFA